MSKFKLVENSETNGFVETTRKLGVNQLTTTDLTFTKVDREDTTNRPYAHLYSSFNLPITENQKLNFDNKYADTAISGLNQSQIIVIEVPQGEYGELIDGKTIELKFPIISGGSDTEITCYSTFFNSSGVININNADNFYSDLNSFSGDFGARSITSDGNTEKNIAYLFSNQIATPKSGGIWDNKTFRNGKKLASYISPKDEPVGIAYLDKGFIVLTNQQIVQNFSYTGTTSSGFDGISAGNPYTGGTGFTQVYFSSSSDASLEFNSIETEYVQSIICVAEQNEFFLSNNPTFRSVNGDTNPDNNPTYITEIGLYNENKELIAIAKPNEPIPKTKSDLITFQIDLKL